jgi:hypothetical protein
VCIDEKSKSDFEESFNLKSTSGGKKMNTLLIQANYCLTALRCAVARRHARQRAERDADAGMLVLPPGGLAYRQAGMSTLAQVLIITGAAVGICIAVIAILGPKIMDLARDIGLSIDSVDATGGSWGE